MNNLEHIKSQIKPILKKYGIKKAGIFGSSARGESVVNDLDLLVKIEKKDQPAGVRQDSTGIGRRIGHEC